MTDVVYRRLADSPPPAREILSVASDGTWTAWRSIAPVIGRFAGRLADVSAFAALAEAAAGAPSVDFDRLPPDAGYEVLELGEGRVSRFVDGEPVQGPLGALLEECRRIIDRPDGPVAAIALAIEPGGVLRLEHRGTEPLRIQLGIAYAELVRWTDGAEAGSGSTRGRGNEVVEAAPGWSRRFEIGEIEGDGGTLGGSVSFIANDAGVWVPVVCEAFSGPSDEAAGQPATSG